MTNTDKGEPMNPTDYYLTHAWKAAEAEADAQLLATFLEATEAAYLARVALSRLQHPVAIDSAYTAYCETRNTARTAEQAYKNRQDRNDQHR